MSAATTDLNFDVIVIGAGPAGYAAAIRAAQLGFKTASIDHWHNAEKIPRLGGTYVNAGCVACISLLESAKIYELLRADLHVHGLAIDGLRLDLAQMLARKEAIATDIDQQIAAIFAAQGITRFYATAKLLNVKQVNITVSDSGVQQVLTAKSIILASGSSPIALACAPINRQTIINSDQALALNTVPQELGILGAGIIGLELAGIWHKLGAKVTLLEAQNQFLPALDHDLSKAAYELYREQGFNIQLGARVISTHPLGGQVEVHYQNASGKHTVIFDKLIVASGRKPNSEHLAAAEAQLLLDENGFVHVDEHCATNLPGVYAIGDLNALGSMLAHKGIEEGIFVAEQLAGQHNPINYHIIPNVIYADPEIAWVGQSEQTLKAIGEPFRVALFPFQANAKAQAINKTTGLVKLITHADTDKILGVHIIGPHAAELIAEAVLAMEFSASSEDLARTIHAHPSLSSVLHETALMLNNRALHCPADRLV